MVVGIYAIHIYSCLIRETVEILLNSTFFLEVERRTVGTYYKLLFYISE